METEKIGISKIFSKKLVFLFSTFVSLSPLHSNAPHGSSREGRSAALSLLLLSRCAESGSERVEVGSNAADAVNADVDDVDAIDNFVSSFFSPVDSHGSARSSNGNDEASVVLCDSSREQQQ